MSKAFWLIVFVLFVIAGALWLSFNWQNQESTSGRPESHQIQAKLLKINADQSLAVLGVHILDAYPNNSDYYHPQSLTVNVNSNTKFFKANSVSAKPGAQGDPGALN